MAQSIATERVSCARRGCSVTFLRLQKVGRPQRYCCVECRTRAATEKRSRAGSPGPRHDDRVLEELKSLRGQIANLTLPQATATPAPTAPTAGDHDLARTVQEACEQLRHVTDYLAANPGDTRSLKYANTVIDNLRRQALRHSI